MAYADAADVAGISSEFSLPAGWDASEVPAVVAAVQERIDQLTRDHWEPSSLDLVLSGDGTTILEFAHVTKWPAISISQVQYREDYDSTDTFDSDGEILDADNYCLSKSRRSLLRSPNSSGVWVSGMENYKVAGSFGRTNIPEGIKRLTVLLAREHIKPGYLVEITEPQSEWYPDGYRWIASQNRVGKRTSYTGYSVVDDLIEAFINKTPVMVVP